MLPNDASLKNFIQQGVRIDTAGGQFHQGDETNIQDFSQGTLSVQAGTISINIQNSAGINTDITKNFQDLRNQITLQYEERIKLLTEQINDKKERIDLLTEKESGQRQKYEGEIAKLKAEYDEHINDYKYKESQFNNFLELITHVDTNNTSENFKQALDLFVAGNEEEALSLLDDDKAEEELKKTEELESRAKEIEKKLNEAKEEALESKRKIAYERFLKANFFALKGEFKNAESCYKKGVAILSDNLTNHYYASFLISQNRLEESLYYFEKAIELAQTESAKAKSLALLALTLLDMNEVKKADEKTGQAEEIISRLHAENDEPLSITDTNIYIARGRIAFERFEIADAIKYTNTALEMFDKLDEEPDVKDSWRAICLANLGLFYSVNIQYDEAIRFTKMFLEISEDLFAKNPKSPALMAGIITSYNNLGRYDLALKNFQLAEENLKKGIELAESFDGYPLIISKITAMLYCNLGRLYADIYSRIPEARSFFEKAVEYRNKTLRNDYETVKFNTSFALLYLARIHFYEKDFPKCEEYFKECLRIVDNQPGDLLGAYAIFEGNVYYYYGNFLFEKKLTEEACLYWQKSIDVYEKLFVADNPLIVLLLTESIINVGKNYSDLIKDNDRAFALYERAFDFDIAHKIIYPESDVSGVIEAYGKLFGFYSENTDPATLSETSGKAEKVLRRIEEILAGFPGLRENYLMGLALSKRVIGVSYFQRKDHLSAEKWFEEEYEIFEKLVAEDPDKYKPESLQLYFNACQNYLLLGDTYLGNDKDKANEKYEAGIGCLNIANQLSIDYPDHPTSKYLKPIIDVEIAQLNALIAANTAAEATQ